MRPSEKLHEHDASPKAYLFLLIFIVLAYCIWVLSLPLFPTQDGPMHLYFMHVLQAVLTHPGGFYGHFYFIRHILPPYAIYYYLLMLLSSIVPVLIADKIVICLFFISFAFGFRYLARTVGPNGDVMALLATALMLNWPLGMGFVNFCLSTSFALWALGLWCRAAARPDTPRKVGFVLLCYLIMFTHPIPLLGIGAFCFLELCVRLVWQRQPKTNESSSVFPRFWLTDALYLLIAMATLAYVKLFTVAHIFTQVHGTQESFIAHEISLLRGYVLLHSLSPFAGQGLSDALQRSVLYALLVGSVWLALRQHARTSRLPLGHISERQRIVQIWTLVSLLFLVGFIFIPSDLNNSAYFSARLILFIWLAAMIAASGARFDSPRVRPALAGIAVLNAALTLFMAHQRINPIAQQIAIVEDMPLSVSSGVGLLLHDPKYKIPSTISYDPYFWSGVRMFRRTNSVLYNTPWLDLPIIPLGPRSYMPTGTLNANVLEYPPGLRKEMSGSPIVRARVLSHVNFAIISSGSIHPSKPPDTLLSSASGTEKGLQTWACKDDDDYSFCTTGKPALAQGLSSQSIHSH